jgi:dihydropteroate synthase
MHGWQKNMFPVSILVEEVPVELVEMCETWIKENLGVLEIYPSKLGSVSQRDLLLVVPLKAFKNISGKYEKCSEFFSAIRDVFNNVRRPETTLNCGGKSLKLGKHPRVMGIINVTPDSFSDGGVHFKIEDAIERAHQMVEEGADIIDVGGESSRPGSDPVDIWEESSRIIPVISRLVRELSVPVSVDTTKSEVARAALDAGAGMINDISGLHWDLKLAEFAARYKVPVVVMHTRGKPKTMQKDIHYESLISEILRYLKEGVEVAHAAGVPEDQIIVDPGMGFGKKLENNLEIMNHLFEFSVLGKPVLVGASRKTFIGKVLGLEMDQRVEGTLATTIYGILRGIDIVRVHDVKENVRAIRMLEHMMGSNEEALG